MVDPTSDSIDRAYSQAENLLNEQAERSARRARVLAALEQDAVIRPILRQKSMPRFTSRGGWLVAASVLIASGFLVMRFLPLNQLWSSRPIAQAPVAKLVQKNEMTAALSPPAPVIDQSESAPSGPKAKASDQAPTASHEPRESSGKQMDLAAPQPPPAMVAPPPPAVPASRMAAPPPPTPRAFAMAARQPPAAAPAPLMAAPPPPPPAARAFAMVAPPPAAAPAPTMAAPPAPPVAAPSPPSPGPAPPPTADTAKPIGELRSNLGFDRLRAAAAAGRTIEVQELLNRQIPVDVADANGETALMKSIRADQPATAALLIHHGASLDKKNNAGLSARDLATQINDPALNHALGLEH
jgi:hypothetical protein